MKKKIDVLRELAHAGKWEDAIKLASSFPQLGTEKKSIMKAREAIIRPEFQIQLGKNPATLIAAGIDAIRSKYRLH